MTTRTDWAVWSKFDDGWMAVDHGDPDHCREGAARRNRTADEHDIPQSFSAGPITPDGKIVWPWEARTYVEPSGAQKRARRRAEEGAPVDTAAAARDWIISAGATAQARAWAVAEGYAVNELGVLPDYVLLDYRAAVDAGEA